MDVLSPFISVLCHIATRQLPPRASTYVAIRGRDFKHDRVDEPDAEVGPTHPQTHHDVLIEVDVGSKVDERLCGNVKLKRRV